MKKLTLWILCGITVLAVAALACGPQLTAAFISSARAILNAPETHLGFNLKLIRHQPDPPKKLQASARQTKNWDQSLPSTLEVDVADLRRMLTAANFPEEERELVLSEYEGLRLDQLSQWEDAEMRSVPRGIRKGPGAIRGHEWIEKQSWPACVPNEFRLYAEGASDLNARDFVGAQQKWLEILKLPIEQRHERSAWAAWMLMKTAPTHNDAVHWLREVCRVIEEEDCADSLRMHPAALALLSSRQDEPAAVETLVLHFINAKANERSAYVDQLKQAAFAIARSDDGQLRIAAAKNVATREIVTSVLAHAVDRIDGSVDDPYSRFGSDNPTARALMNWAETLNLADVQNDSFLGDFGIALYRIRQYDLARKFIALGSRSWETLWIQSKLDLQRGRSADAARHMADALRLLPAAERGHIVSVTESVYERIETVERMDDDWLHGVRNSRFLAECATVRLSQSDFASALRLFLDAECPHDAAYVAEQLLSSEEVLDFVRKSRLRFVEEGNAPSPLEQPWYARQTDNPTNRFLYLVGRKLARDGFYKNARPYYPAALVPYFDRYVALMKRGRSAAVPREVRAACLMEAARFHRWIGMELFGAEIEPDAAVWGGSFRYEPLFQMRKAARAGFDYGPTFEDQKYVWKLQPAKLPIPLRPSADEISRAKRYGLGDRPRYHFRYTAAQMAREASHLLPRDSNEAAAMLAEGGLWLPPNEGGTDPFFEELITRFDKTPLGLDADKRRWYPDEFRQQAQQWDPAAALRMPIPGDE